MFIFISLVLFFDTVKYNVYEYGRIISKMYFILKTFFKLSSLSDFLSSLTQTGRGLRKINHTANPLLQFVKGARLIGPDQNNNINWDEWQREAGCILLLSMWNPALGLSSDGKKKYQNVFKQRHSTTHELLLTPNLVLSLPLQLLPGYDGLHPLSLQSGSFLLCPPSFLLQPYRPVQLLPELCRAQVAL